MKSTSLVEARHLSGTPKPAKLEALARRLVLGQLEGLQTGCLDLIEGGRQWRFGRRRNSSDLHAEIRVLDPSFYSDVAFGGTIGAGEAYMHGAWQCDDLVAVVRLMLRNRRVMNGLEKGTARLTRPLQKLFHWIHRNTRSGARRNIAAHYDLGNDFFALWLDESMMYSSAIFEDDAISLADAQCHRLNVICDRLELGPDDHLVEIGTGWGGFAVHAARTRGCRVTTTTISSQQYEMARRRIRDAGLDDRIELLNRDYRDLDGSYDKLVSIEMIEAIGSSQYPEYFSKCRALLEPGGKMLIQAITIADQYYAEAQKNVDFIQRYIFPGSCLPSLSAMVSTIASETDLLVTGIDDIGRSYALTLERWRRNFRDQIESVRQMGYSEEFIRMWEFYFTYCEGGFRERTISDVHLVAERSRH